MFVAIGINGEGRRQLLGVEFSNRESRSSWKTFVTGLQTRGLHGVEFVVSDDHAGLKRAVRELLPEAVWQRCYVHFLRNALDYLPRKADDDCRQELRWLYDRRNLKEAEQDLQAWLKRWERRYPKLTDWVEAHIGETLNFYSLPRQHHKHLKSTNMLERLNEEIKRRTRVVRIFPNPASCLRLVRALCAETHEGWLEENRYLIEADEARHMVDPTDRGLTRRADHNRRSATFITVILVFVRVVVGHRVCDVAVLANLRDIVIAVTHQFLSEGCTSSNRDSTTQRRTPLATSSPRCCHYLPKEYLR